MRLVSAVLFVALTGAWALADEAKPADPKPELTKKKVPYRVVKMLPETGQVLLFDRDRASHVVAEVGQTLDGYLVEDIDDDEVTLVAENGAQVILTAPLPPRTAKRITKPAPRPVDPYGDGAEPGDEVSDEVASATSDKDAAGRDAGPVRTAPARTPATGSAPAAPVDPYAEPDAPQTPGEGGVRVASASAASTATATAPAASVSPAPPPPDLADPYGDPGIAAFAEAVGATPAAETTDAPAARPTKAAKAAKSAKSSKSAGATPSDAASALAAAATGEPASELPKTDGTTTIARAELDGALANFGTLAHSFRATFTADGLRFDAISDGTLLTKIGLRKGDMITYVDGQPLRSLDDAANLYARASTVKNTTIQVVRGGKLVTLRVAIR